LLYWLVCVISLGQHIQFQVQSREIHIETQRRGEADKKLCSLRASAFHIEI
jgi:hypothetical protein